MHKGSSSEEYSDSPSRRPLHLTFGLPKISPLARFWIAVVIAVAASAAAFIQSPRPDALRPPRWFISTAWWRYPFEWNAANRLPKIECSLRAIHAVPNSTSIWAAGNKGMVVSSTDGGKSWSKKGIEERQLTPDAAPSPSPASSPTPATQTLSEFFDWLDIVPVAVAAQDPNFPAPVQAKPTPTVNRSNVGRSNSGRPERATATPTPLPAGLIPEPLETLRLRLEGSPRPRPTSSPVQPTASPSPSPGTTATPNAIPPETEQLIAVRFVDENSGEAVSNMATRFTTKDSGESWVRHDKYLPKIVIETSIREVGRNILFGEEIEFEILPFGNAFLAPTHDGFSWVTTADRLFRFKNEDAATLSWEPPPQYLSSVSGVYFLADQSKGWAVTTDASVYHSIDKGVSWLELPIANTEALRGVFFVDQKRGWVGGANMAPSTLPAMAAQPGTGRAAARRASSTPSISYRTLSMVGLRAMTV